MTYVASDGAIAAAVSVRGPHRRRLSRTGGPGGRIIRATRLMLTVSMSYEPRTYSSLPRSGPAVLIASFLSLFLLADMSLSYRSQSPFLHAS